MNDQFEEALECFNKLLENSPDDKETLREI